MTRWRNPKKELPHDGQIVAVLERHWKGKFPESYEIWFGETVSSLQQGEVIVENADYTGLGMKTALLCGPETSAITRAFAWAPHDEIDLPKDFEQ